MDIVHVMGGSDRDRFSQFLPGHPHPTAFLVCIQTLPRQAPTKVTLSNLHKYTMKKMLADKHPAAIHAVSKAAVSGCGPVLVVFARSP